MANNNPISLSTEEMEELMGMIDDMVARAIGYVAGKTSYIIDCENEVNVEKFKSMFEDFVVNGDDRYLFDLIDEKYLEGWVWLDE